MLLYGWKLVSCLMLVLIMNFLKFPEWNNKVCGGAVKINNFSLLLKPWRFGETKPASGTSTLVNLAAANQRLWAACVLQRHEGSEWKCETQNVRQRDQKMWDINIEDDLSLWCNREEASSCILSTWICATVFVFGCVYVSKKFLSNQFCTIQP